MNSYKCVILKVFKDKTGVILYFIYCQHIPQKDQKQLCISPSLIAVLLFFLIVYWRQKSLKTGHK